MASLSEVLLLIRWSGFKHLFRILQNTLKREQLDRQYLEERQPLFQQPALNPGKLIHALQIENGAQFEFENASLEAIYLAPDLLRLTWEPGIPPLPYAIQEVNWPSTPIAFQEAANGWKLSSALLQLGIQQDGSLQFKDQQDHLIRAELPPLLQGLSNLTKWTSRSPLSSNQCIYGLGEQSESLNLRGTTHTLWNNDPGGSYGPGFDPLYMPLPVYFSLNSEGSYLLFYENSFRGQIDIDPKTSSETNLEPYANPNPLIQAHFEGGQLRYYFILGEPDQAMQRFAQLTGFPAMPPIWSLGYHQSRWGYKHESDIHEVASGFQKHKMPLSAIHLDIDYLDGYRVFTVDQERFPDLSALASQLDQQGIQLVTIIDPGVKQDPDYFLYQEGLAGGYFCKGPDGKPVIGLVWPGWSAFPDFTNPQTRTWWSRQYVSLLEAGVAGVWHDMNEPASFSARGNPTLPLSTRHHLEGKGGDHLQAHNLYGLLMNRAAYDGLRRNRPQHRPWILSRSGWVSSQRYAWKWTGDTETTWDSLRMTISTVLGTGLSGQPYSGPDIGGFRGDPPAELFLRYFQLSAFLPFFRTHSAVGSKRREPWVYGEPYTTIIRDFLNLRYQLLPYFYTLAWIAHQTGRPLVRPLFWSDIQDQDLWEVDDAFLLGEHLLVAPALQPDAASRKVRLPAGRWHNWWDGRLYTGPDTITIPLSLENIPVLVRDGSLIPIRVDQMMQFHFYYSPDQPLPVKAWLAGQLYSDVGDGYDDYRCDSFHASAEENKITITWETDGNYPFPHQQINLILHGLQPREVIADGLPCPVSNLKISCQQFKKLQIIL